MGNAEQLADVEGVLTRAPLYSAKRCSVDKGCTPFERCGLGLSCRSRPGGVLMRPGHTEAGVDLARLAGCQPAGGVQARALMLVHSEITGHTSQCVQAVPGIPTAMLCTAPLNSS